MYTIKALAEMHGLTPKQARDRVTALKPLIDLYSRDGKENAIQYLEQGRAMLDRLLQVEREHGFTIKAAADQVKEEFQSHFPGQTGHVDEDLLDRIQELETELEDQSKAYENRLAELQRTITKHDGRLAEVEEQVQYMLEAPQDDTDSAVDAAADGANGHASEGTQHDTDPPIEIAVDGNLPRWRRALANVPRMISRVFS
jgi:uncharacterized coiled-coil protein SlyX